MKNANQRLHTPENNEVLNSITDPFPSTIAKQLPKKKNAMNCFRISTNLKNGLCVGLFHFIFSCFRENKNVYLYTDQ